VGRLFEHLPVDKAALLVAGDGPPTSGRTSFASSLVASARDCSGDRRHDAGVASLAC